jgi:ketosteroid isomerase-like protein
MFLNLFLTLALGAAQAAPAQNEILKREQQRVDALASGKLDDVAAMLSPSLTYTHSSGAIDNKEGFLQSLRSGQVVYKALKHSELQVRFPTPDVAILNGLSEVDVVIGGKPQHVPLRFTIVYVRTGGQWLMEVWQSTRRAN